MRQKGKQSFVPCQSQQVVQRVTGNETIVQRDRNLLSWGSCSGPNQRQRTPASFNHYREEYYGRSIETMVGGYSDSPQLFSHAWEQSNQLDQYLQVIGHCRPAVRGGTFSAKLPAAAGSLPHPPRS